MQEGKAVQGYSYKRPLGERKWPKFQRSAIAEGKSTVKSIFVSLAIILLMFLCPYLYADTLGDSPDYYYVIYIKQTDVYMPSASSTLAYQTIPEIQITECASLELAKQEIMEQQNNRCIRLYKIEQGRLVEMQYSIDNIIVIKGRVGEP